MAIVVEERGDKVGILNILIWVVIVAVIVAAIYYIFFKRPTLIEIAVPASFQHTEELLKIDLNPEEVVNNPQFQELKPYITPPPPAGTGRANPFLSF